MRNTFIPMLWHLEGNDTREYYSGGDDERRRSVEDGGVHTSVWVINENMYGVGHVTLAQSHVIIGHVSIQHVSYCHMTTTIPYHPYTSMDTSSPTLLPALPHYFYFPVPSPFHHSLNNDT